MKLFTRKIVALIKAHLGAFDYQLDPIAFKAHNSRTNYQFVIALFAILLFPLYGTLGLEYEAVGWIDWNNLSHSPYLYIHQMGLPKFRSQLDFGMAIDTLACVCVYAILAFKPEISDKFKLKPATKGLRLKLGAQVLSKEVSSRIGIFGKKIKSRFRIIIAVLYLFTLVYFLVQVWLNSVYTRTVQSFVLWLVIFPFYWFYIVYGAYASIVVVMMASGYVRICMQPILDGLLLLNSNLKRRKFAPKRLSFCWNYYLKLNQSAIHVCGAIHAYSRYCGPILTVMFPFYVVLQCYFAYIVFLVDTSPFLEKQHYFYSLLVLELFLFAIIYQCARVVKINQRIVRENLNFFLFYQRQQSLRKQTSQLLKIISYIAVFFLLLIKNQRTKQLSKQAG